MAEVSSEDGDSFSETLVYKSTGVTTQKASIDIFTAVKT
jgi:hypothetical protein